MISVTRLCSVSIGSVLILNYLPYASFKRISVYQGLQEKFARRNKTALGPGDRDDTVKQPEFRSPSEFYIIIFQCKLKIVENTKNKMIKI